MTEELCELTLEEISAAIRQHEVSSVEVTRACLERISHFQHKVGCFISVEPAEALDAARAADTEIAEGKWRGPLHGVPLAHKDIFDRAGRTTTAGSSIPWPTASSSATVIERLNAAGAVQIGTLNLDEFAAGGTGDNPHFGRCRNPWNQAFITGGSSGGTAAAVAARFVYAALGSDTGGSIRLPAAICGVTAIKPTYGLVSRYGTFPRAWSFDSIGLAARTARDCALVLRAIAGADPRDPTTSRLPVPNYVKKRGSVPSPLRVGIALNQFAVECHPDIFIKLSEVEHVLSACGAILRTAEIPNLDVMTDLHQIVVKCEAASVHGETMRQYRGLVSRATINVLDEGFLLPATRYIEALSLRPKLLADFVEKVFTNHDVVMLPVLMMLTPEYMEANLSNPANISALFKRTARCLRFINYLGLPSLALPCGFAGNGLPVGFQIVARPFQERPLFALADAYQSATSWHTARPIL